MKNFRVVLTSLALGLLPLSGCGYSQKTILPQNIKTIHVDTVINAIPVSEIYAYHPGVEMMITNAIIRRLHLDGNLQVAEREKADAILESKMIRFEQEGVRFNQIENVQEYRLFIVLALRLIDTKTNAVIWEEPNFSADSEFFVSEVRPIARQEAVERAINRLARNVVDRIVEDW